MRPAFGRRLSLDQAGCVAGAVISGQVALDDDATVELLRHERVLHGEYVFKVVEARSSQSDGTFALSIPDQMLPSATGQRCELRYSVCARSEREAAGAPLEVTASARPHLAGDPFATERPLMSWDARHFHIELSDARLEGGGQLVGRVHRHGDWPPGEIAVTARCQECWRAAALAVRGLPHWEFKTLWERHHALRTDLDSTWVPFHFDLPQWLPPAVEATTLAWRYELIAQRSVRYWFDETAAITPLLHEGAALRRGGQLIRDCSSSSASAAAAGAAWISPVPHLRGVRRVQAYAASLTAATCAAFAREYERRSTWPCSTARCFICSYSRAAVGCSRR